MIQPKFLLRWAESFGFDVTPTQENLQETMFNAYYLYQILLQLDKSRFVSFPFIKQNMNNANVASLNWDGILELFSQVASGVPRFPGFSEQTQQGLLTPFELFIYQVLQKIFDYYIIEQQILVQKQMIQETISSIVRTHGFAIPKQINSLFQTDFIKSLTDCCFPSLLLNCIKSSFNSNFDIGITKINMINTERLEFNRLAVQLFLSLNLPIFFTPEELIEAPNQPEFYIYQVFTWLCACNRYRYIIQVPSTPIRFAQEESQFQESFKSSIMSKSRLNNQKEQIIFAANLIAEPVFIQIQQDGFLFEFCSGSSQKILGEEKNNYDNFINFSSTPQLEKELTYRKQFFVFQSEVQELTMKGNRLIFQSKDFCFREIPFVQQFLLSFSDEAKAQQTANEIMQIMN